MASASLSVPVLPMNAQCIMSGCLRQYVVSGLALLSELFCTAGRAVANQRSKCDIATKFGAAGNVGASAKVCQLVNQILHRITLLVIHLQSLRGHLSV